MAELNIKVQIQKPGTTGIITFTDYAANDTLRIPYRYPFADVVNLEELQEAGLIRGLTDTSTELGGANGENGVGNLGYQLPRTEKIIFLLKAKAGGTINLTFSGKENKTHLVEVVANAANDIIAVDLFSLGIYIGNEDIGKGVTIVSDTAVGLALIAR